MTIVIVVARSGLEKAVQAVHAECGLGQKAEATRLASCYSQAGFNSPEASFA